MATGGNKILDRRVFYDGQVIFREGSDGYSAFLVMGGEVRLVQNHGTDNELELEVIGKGTIFGEMALFDSQSRLASAIAKGTVQLVAIGRTDFESKIGRIDAPDRQMLEDMIAYCRNTPVLEERLKHPELAGESLDDRSMRLLLEARYAAAVARLTDPFLVALFSLLRRYTNRRLPPAA